MESTDRQMYIIVANHDRQECGVTSNVSAAQAERAMLAIANYRGNDRKIDGYVSAFPSRKAAKVAAKAKHEEYHFLGDYKDVLKEMESVPPRPR